MHLDDNVAAAFVQGALPDEAARAIQEHVAACRECDALLVEMARLYEPASSRRQAVSDVRTISEGAATELAAGAMNEPPSSGFRHRAPSPGDGPPAARYRLLDRLGEGGMGMVFAAWDTRLDRKVAIKLLRPELAGMSGAEQRLAEEARALAKVSHPHVVQVFDVGRWDGDGPRELGPRPVYVAMEHVDGWTLREWLRAARPSIEAVLDAFESAGRALAAVHAACLSHRDFKPDNVLVGKDGRVRVTDFGLARAPIEPAVNEPGAVHSTLSGTPAYMAPEQLFGQGADARSDQFAFCVTLVEALGGHRPFAANSLGELRSAFARRAPPSLALPVDAPTGLARVIARGLEHDPASRYPDMGALLDDLRRVRERAPSPHIVINMVCLIALTFVHVGAVGSMGYSIATPEAARPPVTAFVAPAPSRLALASRVPTTTAYMSGGEEPIDIVAATCLGCIAAMWAPFGLFLAPLTAVGLWRRRHWAWMSGVLYALISLPTCIVTPYAIYALVSLTSIRVREDLNRR